MQPVKTYNVSPRLPDVLEPLRELAHNLWWTWEPDARSLFRHLDEELWDATNHNPIRMLQLSRQARLVELASDDDYLREMRRIYQEDFSKIPVLLEQERRKRQPVAALAESVAIELDQLPLF